jgi:voltage-gated sodium channel
MKMKLRRLVNNKYFEYFIILIILINSTLIGVETYFTNHFIHISHIVALTIFTIEIVLRWFARVSVKEFFKSGWNIFDLSIVIIGYIPEAWFSDAEAIVAIRVLRVFRVLRLIRAAPEIKLIISVLTRSLSALTYNAIFFFIFLYLFAIIGTTLFKLPEANTADPETLAKIEQFNEKVTRAPEISPDPYGTLDETFFTLFRILTGEDWTDLRYNLTVASKLKLIPVSETVITAFHVIWFILSAFLMLNLLVGAILNNYQVIMDEERQRQKERQQRKEDRLKSE